jgi:hypothetical protein
MDLQDFGSIGELVGGLAVLISFLYLARQIRQSSRAARAATEQSIAQGWALALSIPAQNSHNSDVYYRGLRDPAALSESELSHFSLMLQLLFNQYEQAYLSYRDGTFSQRRWVRIDNAIRSYLPRPGFKFWWEVLGNLLTAEFAEYLKRRIDEASETATQQADELDVE